MLAPVMKKHSCPALTGGAFLCAPPPVDHHAALLASSPPGANLTTLSGDFTPFGRARLEAFEF